jgi:hypothetical protein
MFAEFDRGMEVEINYPVSTHVRFFRPDQMRRREVVIHAARDLVTDPLTIAEFMRRPFLLRSRYLVKAYEPEIRQWRQFYWGSTREYAAPGILRVGLYEPSAEKASWVYDRAFLPTPEDRRELIKSLRQWEKIDFGSASVRIFADDQPAGARSTA